MLFPGRKGLTTQIVIIRLLDLHYEKTITTALADAIIYF